MSATNISEEDIVWSDKDFRLSDFVKIYEPPQIVKVEEGYMDDTEEDRTLSASQVLTLHIVKDLTIVSAFDSKRRPISLPTSSSAKLEIICMRIYYETVEEVASDLPPYVASVEKHPWLKIDVNDILEVKGVSKTFRSGHLLCLNLTSGLNVDIPINYRARFKSLGGCPVIHPTMADITKHCSFPVLVRYIDDKLKVIRENYNAGYPCGMDALGPLHLTRVMVKQVIYTTSWEDCSRVIPLQLNLDIRVVAALGALQNDDEYAKLCKISHSNTKIDDLALKYIKEGEYKVLLDEGAPRSKKVDENDERDLYFEVRPPVPSRELKPNRRSLVLSDSGVPTPQRRHETSKARCVSVNIPTVDHLGDINNPDEVFASSVGKTPIKSHLTSAKSAFHDLKKATKHEFKTLKKKFGSKLSNKKEEEPEHYDEAMIDVDDLDISDVLPKQSNISSYESSYKEVKPLPPDIQADRYNPHIFRPLASKSSFSKCKIRNPGNITTWSVDEVSECLKYCRLDEYVERFKEERIDGSLLADLDEESFISLGLTNKLHIMKIMKITKEGWLPKV